MSIENKPAENKIHTLTVKNREGAHLEGVLEVIRFDETEALLETTCGTLSIDGERLHLCEWNTEHGFAVLEGRIDAITYFDKKQEGSTNTHSGLFGKLLK